MRLCNSSIETSYQCGFIHVHEKLMTRKSRVCTTCAPTQLILQYTSGIMYDIEAKNKFTTAV